ncbi:MAG TPA: hypothetical protein VGO17_03445 [Aurantimonas sp.]|nr:hypothetical protein [Aurantimonas sp.]
MTDLEVAALRAIFLETPELALALERQLETLAVIKRENSGHGFFTTMRVADNALAVDSPSVLGLATHARIGGLEHGFSSRRSESGHCLNSPVLQTSGNEVQASRIVGIRRRVVARCMPTR